MAKVELQVKKEKMKDTEKKVTWSLGAGLLAMAMLCSAIGCQSREPLSCVCGKESRLWEQCQAELHRRGFEIAYRNRAEGLMVSQPRISSQWFELWGQDLADAYSVAESSCQSVRRQIRFAIKPEGEQSCCRCEVLVERLELGQPRVDSSFRVGDILRRSGGAPELRERAARRSETWVPIGQDPELAQALLAALSNRIEK